jgi:hypothetical protein
LWHEAKIAFLDKHKDMKCERCGRIGTIVPGHESSDYLHMESYIPKVKENQVEALCPTCNWMESRSRKPCPSCVIAYRETNGQTKIKYIPQFMELCRDCCDPGEVQLRKKEQDQFKDFVRKVRDKDNAKRRKFYREKVKKNGKN